MLGKCSCRYSDKPYPKYQHIRRTRTKLLLQRRHTHTDNLQRPSLPLQSKPRHPSHPKPLILQILQVYVIIFNYLTLSFRERSERASAPFAPELRRYSCPQRALCAFARVHYIGGYEPENVSAAAIEASPVFRPFESQCTRHSLRPWLNASGIS